MVKPRTTGDGAAVIGIAIPFNLWGIDDPDGFIESDEPEERIRELMEEAENACMAHFALRNPIPWSSRLLHNGKELINHSG